MREDQSVSEMATEVLTRQAAARAKRTGESLEVALGAVLRTRPEGVLSGCATGSMRREGRSMAL